MGNKLLKILWVIIIFLFIALQIYHIIKENYADVVTGLLTVIIILAMIIAYWLIARAAKPKIKKEKEKPDDLPRSDNTENIQENEK